MNQRQVKQGITGKPVKKTEKIDLTRVHDEEAHEAYVTGCMSCANPEYYVTYEPRRRRINDTINQSNINTANIKSATI
jgi:hypothetical protein